MEIEIVLLITVVIDIVLIYILLNTEIYEYEMISIYFLFFLHLLLFVFYFLNINIGLDVLHLFYMVYVLFGILYENIYILFLILSLLVLNLFFWIINGKCPFGAFDCLKSKFIDIILKFNNTSGHLIIVLLILLYITKVYLKYEEIK